MNGAAKHRGFGGVTLAVIGLGVGLRVWQYLGNDSFFLDEIAVLRNLVERPWQSVITQPLSYDQVAPPGFLLAEKFLVSAGGTTEYATRLFPLLCAVAATAIFAMLAGRLLSRPSAIASLLMFAAAGPLIVVSAELKQYSSDVLATCVLLLCAVKCISERRARDYYALGIAGLVLVWFSQPAVLVLAGIAAGLLLEEARLIRKHRAETSRPLVLMLTMAAVSAGTSVLFAKHLLTQATQEYMHRFWADGFPPRGSAAWISHPWPYAQMHDFFGVGRWVAFAYPMPALFVILALVGLVILGCRRRSGLLVACPVVVTLAASAARQYPFAGRVILFLVPCFFLAIAAAGEWISSLLARYWRSATLAVPFALAAAACFPIANTLPVYHYEHMRPVMEYVDAKRQIGEKLYVYYGAVPAFWYYGPRSGLGDTAVIAGGCHRGDSRQYLRELDALRGSPRAFVIIGHSLSAYHEREDILRYLDAIGTRLSGYSSPSHLYFPLLDPFDAFEYDFSNQQRLRAASAETFPLVGPNKLNPAYTCGDGPQSMSLSGPERRTNTSSQ